MPGITAENLVRQIHAAPCQLVLVVTGGGSGAIGELLCVPGASRTVLEAIVPYSAQSLVEFLRITPEHFCSEKTARLMAMAAFQRARHLQQTAISKPSPSGRGKGEGAVVPTALQGDESPSRHPHPDPLPQGEGERPIGVGCTASLASDRPKRGQHRIHVALQTSEVTASHSLELIKGRRSRAEEENIATQLVLNAVAQAVGIDDRLSLPLVDEEKIESHCTVPPKSWQNLLLGRIDAAMEKHPHPGPLAKGEGAKRRAIFPGAFNPLHGGHLRMAEIAAKRLGGPVEFEISIENVDKPPLDFAELELRAAQFAEKSLPLWLTRAPTFDEKSRLFSGATFIVGVDTLQRIGHCRYYDNNVALAEAAFARIAQRGCRFLVFGRLHEGKFETLEGLAIPDSLRKLCDAVPASEFREDVSSTQVRKATSN